MSINFKDDGLNIFKIKNDEPKETLEGFISSNKDGLKKIELTGNDYIQVKPNKNTERNIIYCSGKSGSGKSYFVMQYCKEYHKMFPKNEIILFSSLTSDAGSLDKINNLKKMRLDEKFMNDPEVEDIEYYKDCMVIFDDVDCIGDKLVHKKLNRILSKILEVGRHCKVSCCYTSHLACKGFETRTILNESHYIVYFPMGTPPRISNNLLENYVGLDKKQITTIKDIESRWICIFNQTPSTLFYEKGVILTKYL